MCQVNTRFREIDSSRVNNMSLHEELANISYIFCDKTGTLTKNELVFEKLSLVKSRAEVESPDLVETMIFTAPQGDVTKMYASISEHAKDPSLQHFFRCIGLCHDCIVVETASTEAQSTQQGVIK